MIGICMPFYLKGKKENNSYSRAIRHYASLPYPLHLCGSEGDLSREFCEPFLSDKVKYFEVPQESFCYSSKGDSALRMKFNRSLQTLSRENFWYCLVGADDLVSKDFFSHLEELPREGKMMVGVGMDNPLYIVLERDPSERYSVRLRYRDRFDLLCGINCFSLPLLKKMAFYPYYLEGCETGAELHTKNFGGSVVGLKGSVTMFKESDVLNKLEKIVRVHEVVKISEEEEKYIDALVSLTSK